MFYVDTYYRDLLSAATRRESVHVWLKKQKVLKPKDRQRQKTSLNINMAYTRWNELTTEKILVVMPKLLLFLLDG